MEGLQKFLQLLNDNWTSILVCIGLVIGIVKKTQDYMSKSQDEKIEIAKKQIQTTILKMISDAEVDWQEWSKDKALNRRCLRMYRIMIAQAKRDNYETLYKYLTTNIDGEVIPLELGSKEALDKRVEKMLNEEGYAKSDFIIVRVVDYTIDATAYTNTDVNADTSNIDVTLLRAEK